MLAHDGFVSIRQRGDGVVYLRSLCCFDNLIVLSVRPAVQQVRANAGMEQETSLGHHADQFRQIVM